MTTYRVNIPKVIWFTMNVEAENEEQAIEEAFQEAPSLCVGCSGVGRTWYVEEDEWGTVADVTPAFAITAERIDR
jgi:hypothetical protein